MDIIAIKAQDLNELLSEVAEIKKALVEKSKAPEGFINTDQAAKFFNVSIGTIKNWADNGLVKAYRIEGARNWFFRYSELEAALKSREELKKYRVRM